MPNGAVRVWPTVILIQGLENEEVKEFAQSQPADSDQVMWFSLSSLHHDCIQAPIRNITFKIVGTEV